MHQHLIYIFMIVIVILIMDMVIKKISKTHFVTRSGIIMWKKRKRKMWKYWQKDESIYYHYGGKGHLSCTYCTPKHLTNNEKNIENTLCLWRWWFWLWPYGCYSSWYCYFFPKANGSIDHLIDYESVKKNLILIFTFIWKTNVCTSTKRYVSYW